MIILGLDPGLATTGYGVLSFYSSRFSLLDYGIISTLPTLSESERLAEIEAQLISLFHRFSPDRVAIEQLFFNTNTKTALKVSQARGVLLLTAQHFGKEVFSYTPPQVKLGVCGYGAATKKQVQYMVQKLLNLPNIPKPDDAADALAICICHAHSHRIHSLRGLT